MIEAMRGLFDHPLSPGISMILRVAGAAIRQASVPARSRSLQYYKPYKMKLIREAITSGLYHNLFMTQWLAGQLCARN
jgi:hypothetical protein